MGCFVNSLKIILFVGSVFDALVGIGCFFVAKSFSNLDNRLLMTESVSALQGKITIAIAILGAVTLLTGILGFIGFFKRIRWMQVLFLFLNLIYGICFAAIFAVNVYGKSFMEEQLPNDNCTTGTLKQANDTFKTAKDIWCQNNSISQPAVTGCPCKIPDKTKWSTADQISLNNVALYSNTLTGTNNIQTCSTFTSVFGSQTTQTNFLAAVETTFSCTGICTSDIVFYFTDSSSGPPVSASGGCYTQVREKIFAWLSTAYIYSIISAIITLLSFFSSNFYSLLDFILLIYFYKAILFMCAGGNRDPSTKIEEEQKKKKDQELKEYQTVK